MDPLKFCQHLLSRHIVQIRSPTNLFLNTRRLQSSIQTKDHITCTPNIPSQFATPFSIPAGRREPLLRARAFSKMRFVTAKSPPNPYAEQYITQCDGEKSTQRGCERQQEVPLARANTKSYRHVRRDVRFNETQTKPHGET